MLVCHNSLKIAAVLSPDMEARATLAMCYYEAAQQLCSSQLLFYLVILWAWVIQSTLENGYEETTWKVVVHYGK